MCVRLFLEQGYHQTTINQILKEAEISASSFQNIFRSKIGVLSELVAFMFNSQFDAANSFSGISSVTSPVHIYAIETAIQLTIVEINENIRDMYIEAYTEQETLKQIHEYTAVELKKIFGSFFSEYAEQDFYELEIGTAGMMRGYMVKRCDIYFPLEKKLDRFLVLALNAYRVSEEQVADIIGFIKSLDIRTMAQDILDKLFSALQLRFNFTFSPNTVGDRI